MAKSQTVNNFLDALLAVLAGNTIYYLLAPYLPTGVAGHRPFQGWGLVADFIVCTVIFVAVKLVRARG